MGNETASAPIPEAVIKNPHAARRWLEDNLWKAHPRCPHCDTPDRATLLRPRNKLRRRQPTFNRWKCKVCRKLFTVTTNHAEYHRARLPNKWLAASIILKEDPTISGRQLARRIGVNHNAAIVMKKRLTRDAAQRDAGRTAHDS